jgi:coenzyme F420-0:L-glutamate ligase/coenzyme F420-1:gamma-L-glutamate ligase
VVLLPRDPDASARALRSGLLEATGHNVAVVVTDTAGRAWREGQTDLAVGAAGLQVVDDHAGRTDGYGNPLLVTAPAVADELAGAAELAATKLGRRPFTIVRGRGDLVLAPGDDGPGAVALLRPAGADLFGLGTREAVLAALSRRPDDQVGFGEPVDGETLAAILEPLTGGTVGLAAGVVTVTVDDPRARWVAEVASYAHGWEVADRDASVTRLRPVTT